MRRRKLHGLGLSPDEHETKTNYHLKLAAEHFDDAIVFANNVKCKQALDSLTQGFIQGGKASAHHESRGSVPFTARLKESADFARQVVKNVCIVSSADIKMVQKLERKARKGKRARRKLKALKSTKKGGKKGARKKARKSYSYSSSSSSSSSD
jgi:hypothetical protein